MHALRQSLRLLVLMVFILSGDMLYAQYYSTGQEPASIKWRQLKTAHFKLIFPDYYEANARKLAAYLDSTYSYAGRSLDYQPKRISLVLHTQSAKSNAVVAWAPKRIEFYTTPPQDMYAQPWLEQLALHEYRHVVQTEKLNQGPTKVISLIFGQQGTGAVLGLYVPYWFLEGDAVVAETGMSYSGRGRSPLFEMKLRSQVLEKGIYSYDKAVLGSYHDFIPGSYELGYILVAEGRRKYGCALWSHSLDRIARRPYMVTPLQKGIKDISGLRKIPFYQESLGDVQQRWLDQDSLTGTEEPIHLSPASKHYTDYRHPAFINDSTVVALRSGLDDISRFVRIEKDGSEKVIFTPGLIKPEAVSYAAGKICWAETKPDLRWANRSNTVIMIFNIETGKARTINNHLKLFAPALNSDASKIVAVHTDSLDQYSLVILDVMSGAIEMKMPTASNIFPLTPVWAGDELIIAVLVSENGKTLAKFDASSGRYKTFLNWDHTEISQPYFRAPYIYFTGSWSGISNIYALSKEDATIHQLTSSRFGAMDPYIAGDAKSMVYVDYTADGHRIARQQMVQEKWIPLENVKDRSIKLYKSIAEQETIVPPWSEAEPTELPSKKYSKLANLFNFHSWAPLDINANTYTVNPGVSIMSQNLLSSSFLSAGYSYNLSEEAGKVYGSYSYSGWYPIIDLYADYGLRRQNVYLPEETEVSWDETNLKAGLRLPLNLQRGKYFTGITPSAYVNQGFRKMKPNSPVSFKKSNVFSALYSITAYNQIKTSFRDLYPKWGQSIGLYYRDTPLDQDNMSSIFAGIASLYFPGILRHQGLNIYAGYQYRVTGYYKFSDIVSYPRGITDVQDQELVSFKGTYAFPIAYPDWSVGPVLYLKRIRANLFYDYAVGLNTTGKNYYNSTGIDLITEVHVLRFLAPIDLGVRCTYLPDEGNVAWSFLFGIGLPSFYVNKESVQPNMGL